MNDVWTFPGKQKRTCLFPPFVQLKSRISGFRMNEWPMNFNLKKKPLTLTGNLKFRRKNNWFVTGTFCFVTGKNQKLSRALLQICKNCHGHFSFFTGIFLAFLSRATSQFSRAKFGVFCHGHFFKITGTFSKSVTGKPKNVTGKKKHCSQGGGT